MAVAESNRTSHVLRVGDRLSMMVLKPGHYAATLETSSARTDQVVRVVYRPTDAERLTRSWSDYASPIAVAPRGLRTLTMSARR